MATIDSVKAVLGETLQLGERTKHLTPSTRLLGDVPELDSMAVVSVITALEERFGFTVNDDEVSAAIFETVGTLSTFVEQKLQS